MTNPPPSVWTALGLSPELEMHAGHQSKVFLATGRAGRLIVKLVEADQVDAAARRRVEITRRLAEINPAVVGPIELGSNLVTQVDAWQVVCQPYVEGTSPNTDDRRDVEAMAATLALLHDSLASLTEAELPPVAALRDAADGPLRDGQVIHGDYAASNLIDTPSGLRIIDFDDCGLASVEFEIGNSLYMVLFDSWHAGTLDRYRRFRSWFVEAYRRTASSDLDDALLDEAIQIRAQALGRWLAEPAKAPIGVRTATARWRQRLQVFVDDISS